MLAGVAVCLAACGTTVPTASLPAGSVPGGPPPSAYEQGPLPQVTEPASRTTTDGAGAPVASGTTGGGGPGIPDPTSSPVVPGGTLRVGALINKGDAGAALGAPTGFDDYTGVVKAVAAYVSSHGGLAGRTLDVVVEKVDISDQSAGVQTEVQNKACVSMTEDHKVFLVLDFTGLVQYARGCYVRHRTPLLTMSLEADITDYRTYAPWVMPSLWMDYTTMARALPVALREAGFLTRHVGVLTFDSPGMKRASALLSREIAQQGGKVVDTVYAPIDTQGLAQAAASAVLRFKREGVDRVVLFHSGIGIWLVFSHTADTQDYHPSYGFSTWNFPGLVLDNAPARNQLQGAVGLGFWDALDVSASAQPPLTAREKLCWSVINKATGKGYDKRGNGSPSYNGLDVCELFLLAQRAMQPWTGRVVSRADVPTGLLGLGNGYAPVQFVGSRFRPGRATGISAYARVGYVASCDCFRYLTAFRPLPV